MGVFCKAPFSYFGLNPNGTVQPCCINNVGVNHSERRSLHEIWFGTEYSKLRASLSLGETDYYYCKYCFTKRGCPSCHARVYDDFVINDNGYPSFLKLVGSNRCNLKCSMCNEVFSSCFTHAESAFFLRDDYFEELADFIPHLHTLSLSGGEPLLVEKNYQLVERTKIDAPDAAIHITTNGTVWPKVANELFNSSKVFITVSLDSIEKETYRKIRKGANYERVVSNLDKINRLDCSLDVNVCLTTLNLTSLFDTLQYLSLKNIPFNTIVAKHPLSLSLYYADSPTVTLEIKKLKDKIDNVRCDNHFNAFLRTSEQLDQILAYRETRPIITEENLTSRAIFQRRLVSTLCRDGKKSLKDIDEIMKTIPLYLFTKDLVNGFFIYNSPEELSQLKYYSNSTIQGFLISNAFYLS